MAYYKCVPINNVDPTKDSFTQDEFIKVIKAGKQAQMQVGALITLNNTYCDTYEVIGVNHDSTTDTVDIMAHTQVGNMAFGSSFATPYSSSNVREWINGAYLSSFDASVQNVAKAMDVKSYNPVASALETLQDKVKILSGFEIFRYNIPSMLSTREGDFYSDIFPDVDCNTNRSERWRDAGSYGSSKYYFTRSVEYDSGNVLVANIASSGALNSTWPSTGPYSSGGVLPVLRF